jgi:hypothetical protein
MQDEGPAHENHQARVSQGRERELTTRHARVPGETGRIVPPKPEDERGHEKRNEDREKVRHAPIDWRLGTQDSGRNHLRVAVGRRPAKPQPESGAHAGQAHVQKTCAFQKGQGGSGPEKIPVRVKNRGAVNSHDEVAPSFSPQLVVAALWNVQLTHPAQPPLARGRRGLKIATDEIDGTARRRGNLSEGGPHFGSKPGGGTSRHHERQGDPRRE